MKVKYFKAKINTKRFRKGQKVWVRHEYANHLEVWSKWRNSGRYTQSTLDKWDWSNKDVNWNKVIGENGLSEMEVDDAFAERILGRFNCL